MRVGEVRKDLCDEGRESLFSDVDRVNELRRERIPGDLGGAVHAEKCVRPKAGRGEGTVRLVNALQAFSRL